MIAHGPGCELVIRQALTTALLQDDLDRAITLGLLAYAPPSTVCPTCADDIARIVDARDARLRALAARERFRARQARMTERAQARARKRSAAEALAATASGLPPAAAAALARAKAKAAAKRSE